MKNGHVLVWGQEISTIDLESFSSPDDVFNFIDDIWRAVEKAESEGIITGNSGQELSDVFGPEFSSQLFAIRDRLIERRDSDTPVVVNGGTFTQAFRFSIYREGWELDGTGWVVNTETGLKCVMSNHGTNLFFKNKGVLTELIQRYQGVIAQMEIAVELISSQKIPKKLSRSAVDVDGHQRKIAYTFDVLWSGWASDNRGWVVKTGDKLKLVMSSHGKNQFVEAERLSGIIGDYKKAIIDTQKAIDIVAW
jgi:hypothetical protein